MIKKKLLLGAIVTVFAAAHQTFAGTFSMETLSGGQQVCKMDNVVVSCDAYFGQTGDKINTGVVGSEEGATNATCVMNGKEVPCEQAIESMRGFFGGFVIVFLALGLLSLLLVVFWIWMLVDVIKYQEKDKTLWLLLIIFLGGLGAIVYYFVARRERLKADTQ